MAYFYFDFQNQNTPRAVLRSLIKQMSLQSLAIRTALVTLFSGHAEGQESPKDEELMSMLKSAIQSFENVYIVFDALDECLERDELLRSLDTMHGWKLGMLHLLTTSRREGEIEEALTGLVSHQVPMDGRLVDGDIRMHVRKTVGEDVKFQIWSVEEREMIETTLTKGAHGM